jgi:hypothetical protein
LLKNPFQLIIHNKHVISLDGGNHAVDTATSHKNLKVKGKAILVTVRGGP